MVQDASPDTRRRVGPGDTRARVLPRSRTGWGALALLTLVCLYPVYFGQLENLVGDGAVLILLCTVVSILAFGSGSVALFVSDDRSVLLFLVFAAAVFLLLLGLLFALTLLVMGL